MNGLRKHRMFDSSAFLFLLPGLIGTQIVCAADWPCYCADAVRSAESTEQIKFPLEVSWVYKAAQAPKPACPEPFREPHSMVFDAAFEPVAAGGLVLFGSSADDCVRALDAATGVLKWRFVTGGPVRFAPAVHGGAVYFASLFTP